MKDHLDVSDRPATYVGLAEIATQELDRPVQASEVRRVARADIVHDPDLVAESNQPLGDVGTDKARSPRDQAP